MLNLTVTCSHTHTHTYTDIWCTERIARAVPNTITMRHDAEMKKPISVQVSIQKLSVSVFEVFPFLMWKLNCHSHSRSNSVGQRESEITSNVQAREGQFLVKSLGMMSYGKWKNGKIVIGDFRERKISKRARSVWTFPFSLQLSLHIQQSNKHTRFQKVRF